METFPPVAVVSDTVEAARLVEVEMISRDSMFHTEKSLDPTKCSDWIGHQGFTADHVNLIERKPSEPVSHVVNVYRASYAWIRSVNLSRVGIDDFRLERRTLLVFRQLICTQLQPIGDESLGGIANYEQYLYGSVHIVNKLRYRLDGEIRRRLFYSDLVWKRKRHSFAVPVKVEVIVTIEVVYFPGSCLHGRVKIEKLE